VSPLEEEWQPLPWPKEGEAVSSPYFSNWSSSDDDSKRNLEDDKDAAMETPKDSPCLEWWEEAEHKNEEEDEMLEKQEALLESFAIVRKEESQLCCLDVHAIYCWNQMVAPKSKSYLEVEPWNLMFLLSLYAKYYMYI
jgi:hypothetical protein